MNDNIMSVYIGRLRPFTRAHEGCVKKALSTTSHLTLLVGSSGEPRTFRNPWTFEEVVQMVMGSLSPSDQARITILPLYDMYSDTLWIKQVQERVSESVKLNGMGPLTKIILVGHAKDHTSYYLKLFTQWRQGSIDVPAWKNTPTKHFPGLKPFSATELRKLYFSEDVVSGPSNESLFEDFDATLPVSTQKFLDEFRFTPEFHYLLNEYRFVEKYQKQFEGLKYPPVFVTVDAVVVKSGHVLLIKRKSHPGKGLWALPGGFLNPNERIEDAWLRELKEETKIHEKQYGNVHPNVIRGSLVGTKIFDDPNRDPRGRFITHAHLVKLENGPLPKVKGSDDAEQAKFVPLAEIKRNELYADHYHIIETMVGKLEG